MKAAQKDVMTLEEFKDKNYGKRGTKERDELEAGYKNFKVCAQEIHVGQKSKKK